MRNASGVISGGSTFRQAPLGAGGFVIGMDISTDGTRMIHWADVWNGYIRNAGDTGWKAMLREDNMTEADYTSFPGSPTNDSGIYAARIAPSNKDIIYAAWKGFIFKTTTAGVGASSWVKQTGFSPRNMESNGNPSPPRRFNRAMDIHPTDPNTVIVGTINDGVYYTTNGGTSWTAVSGLPAAADHWLAPINFSSINDGQSITYDRTLAGAVAGDTVVYTEGTSMAGTTVTGSIVENGKIRITHTNNTGSTQSIGERWCGALWRPAATVGFGKYLVAIDPGNPNYVYIHVPGAGLYRSTTGVTGTFSLIAGSELTCSNLVVTAAGKVYMVRFRVTLNGYPSALKTLARGGSTWTSVAGTDIIDQIAIDPQNPNTLVVTDENSVTFRRSTDDGANWTTYSTKYRGPGEIAWLSNRSKGSFPAHLMFDPVAPNKLWMTDGVGITWCNPGATGSTWTMYDYSQGNEELVPNMVFPLPGNNTIVTCWDKPFWQIDDPYRWRNMWNYPIPAGLSFNQGTVAVGSSVDYASDDPNFLLGVVYDSSFGNIYDGTSTDGGKNWVKLPNIPSGHGGWGAVSTKQNWIITRTDNGPGIYTKDGGATWNNISFAGYDPVSNWSWAYYVNRQNVTADKTRPGVFSMLVNNLIPPHVTCTISIASPGVISWYGHDLPNNTPVYFTTTGTLPTGIVSGTVYYVINRTANTFQIAATAGGAAINTSGTQSGTHTGHLTADTLGRSIAGVWLTTDGGTTFTQKFSGVIQTAVAGGGATDQSAQCVFSYVPGKSGEILYADQTNNVNNRLFWSQNDGQTWTYFANVTYVRAVGFGKAAPGQTRPAVYFYGRYNGVMGFYVSLDWFATAPTLIAARPLNHIGGFGNIGGDMNIFGRAYIGLSTAGFAMCDYTDAARAT